MMGLVWFLAISAVCICVWRLHVSDKKDKS